MKCQRGWAGAAGEGRVGAATHLDGGAGAPACLVGHDGQHLGAEVAHAGEGHGPTASDGADTEETGAIDFQDG